MSHTRSADASGFACPTPLCDHPRIVLGHGGGGSLTAELVEQVFLRAFSNPALDRLGDSCVLDVAADIAGGGRLAFATDAHVVRPLVFPGGTIGDLAVHGTVNDLAMSGARPLFLSAAFIVEEGFAVAELAHLVDAMGAAARRAGVMIVTGDTKVVERGKGDGCYVTTAGIGVVPPGIALSPAGLRPGDEVLASGTLGDHGMAIMSVREGLEFESEIASDTAPLHGLVADMLAACPAIRVLRDPTRGGAAASLNELARAAGLGIEIDEAAVPVRPAVAAACEFLGLDPLQVANEGKLLAVVPAEAAGAVLAVMHARPEGRDAVVLGRVVSDHPGTVAMRTRIGGRRVIPMPLGEQLPRIC